MKSKQKQDLMKGEYSRDSLAKHQDADNGKHDWHFHVVRTSRSA